MSKEDQERALALYMSCRFSSPFWGVHFRIGSERLMTLCGMEFDDHGRSLLQGLFSANEVITPADGEPVSCPQCIQIIDELMSVPLDRDAGGNIRQNYSAALRNAAG